MRLSTFLQVLVFSTLATGALAQSYELKIENESLDRVLNRLSETYQLKLSYDPSSVAAYNVDGIFTGKQPDDLLDQVLQDFPFKSKRAKSVLLIIPSKQRTQDHFSGRVIDQSTGQPLAYAYIKVGNDQTTLTDQQGRFKFPSYADSAELSIRYVGYENQETWMTRDSDKLDIRLAQDPTILPDFILDEHQAHQQSTVASHFSINPQQISSLPALGEPDVFKSIQLLPGIRATDESSSGLVVRGSAPEQNLVLLDGFTLYQLDHFFGIFSTFNPHIINNVDVYKGGFMARYGGRISSVVDATAKSANTDQFKGGIGLNMTSINGYIEAPISSKIGLMFGARRSHNALINSSFYNKFLRDNRVDILQAQEPDFATEEISLEPDFNFYDMGGKLRWRATDRSIIDINFFLSADDYVGIYEEDDDFSFFSYEDAANWSNFGISLVWSQNWNSKHNSVMTVSKSEYNSYSISDTEILFAEEEEDDDDDDDEIFRNPLFSDTTYLVLGLEKDNEIEDITIDWQHEIGLNHTQSFLLGASVTFYETFYNFSYRDEEEQYTDFLENISSLSSLYGEYRWAPGPWRFNMGMRYNYYDLLNRSDFEPRLSGSFRINDQLHLSGSWSRHHQYINRLTLSPFGNSDQYYWVVADEEIPVLSSEHLIGGITYRNEHWHLEIEGYHKKSAGLLESDFVLFSHEAGDQEELIGDGENFASGMDVFAKYRNDRFTTWFSYALGFSQNTFDDLNNGDEYWSLYDQRHEFNQVNMFKLGQWEFSSIFVFGSGARYTPPGEINDDDGVFYNIERINELQLPAYHRLDLSAKRTFETKRAFFEAGITLFNVYNRRNIKSRRFTVAYDFDEDEESGEFGITPVDIGLLGITPNIFLNIHFR
ncbi:MAG: TonB-dependent receptor plug domain-containing protein [Cyclobacteriaceae bacterium]